MISKRDRDYKEILRKIKVPLFFFIVFFLSYFVWQALHLPDQSEILVTAQKYFQEYGLIVVFLSAIIEALLLVGLYYPGGLVILLGVIFAGPNPLVVALTVSVVTLGMFAGYIINFFLGKYGWYKLLLRLGLAEEIQRAQGKLNKNGATAIILSNWHPNFGSIMATAAGILHFPLLKFLSISFFSSLAWNIFWGSVAFFFGDVAFSIIGPKFAFVVIVIWVIVIFFRKDPKEKIIESNMDEKFTNHKKYLLIPVVKNPYSRIGPRKKQDWYRQIVRTIEIARELKNKGNEVIISILSNFQPKGKLSEIEIYTEIFTKLAPELYVNSYRETNSTMEQVERSFELAKEMGAELIFISAWMQYPRVKYFSRCKKAYHYGVFGIPQPVYAFGDPLSIILDPVLDILGLATFFRKIQIHQREKGRIW